MNQLTTLQKQLIIEQVLTQRDRPETTADPEGNTHGNWLQNLNVWWNNWYKRYDLNINLVLNGLVIGLTVYGLRRTYKNYNKFTQQFLEKYGKKPNKIYATIKSAPIISTIANLVVPNLEVLMNKWIKEIEAGLQETEKAIAVAKKKGGLGSEATQGLYAVRDELRKALEEYNKNYNKILTELKTATKKGYFNGDITLTKALQLLGYNPGTAAFIKAQNRLFVFKKLLTDPAWRTPSQLRTINSAELQSFLFSTTNRGGDIKEIKDLLRKYTTSYNTLSMLDKIQLDKVFNGEQVAGQIPIARTLVSEFQTTINKMNKPVLVRTLSNHIGTEKAFPNYGTWKAYQEYAKLPTRSSLYEIQKKFWALNYKLTSHFNISMTR